MNRKELTKTFMMISNEKTPLVAMFFFKLIQCFNPLTAGAEYIRVFILYWHIKYHVLNMLKIKCDINQQYLRRVDLYFVKSE